MKITRLYLCVLFALFATYVVAQDSSSDSKSKADTRTITGCLAKASGADEYLLTGKDGSTWEVRSSTVNLSDHVGHTVSATGVVGGSTPKITSAGGIVIAAPLQPSAARNAIP